MDGKSIAESGRLLLLHLTDLQNTNARYRTASKHVLESWGELPHLVRVGKASVALKADGNFTVYPLDMAGRRQPPLAITQQEGTLGIELDMSAGTSPFLAYEILRE